MIRASQRRTTTERCYRDAMTVKPPEKKLRMDRLLLIVVLVAGAGVGIYFLAGR